MDYSNTHVSTSQFSSALSASISTCKFDTKPQHVLIIKRRNTLSVTKAAVNLAKFLSESYGITVIVEPAAVTEMADKAINIKTWPSNISAEELTDVIDFVIAIGGDGTILWVSNLFPGFVPPVVGFSMGSLGYLNQFEIDESEKILQQIVEKAFPVSFRQRIMITIYDKHHKLINQVAAFNECVIDRGPSSFLTVLEVFYNNNFFTNVSADGLILATPSGSTAYSMSAGGPVVHPKVPCFLFTPISPHSLSFRPLVIPNTAKLRIEVSSDSRTSAWVAVDGRGCTEMKQGSYALIELAPHTFPLVINPSTTTLDPWLLSLKRQLNWNQRIRQNVLYESSPRVSPSRESFDFTDVCATNSITTEAHRENNFQNSFLTESKLINTLENTVSRGVSLSSSNETSVNSNLDTVYLNAKTFKAKKALLIMESAADVL